jgi:hypothetical protein
MCEPTNLPFVYNRHHPPLFFTPPASALEKLIWDQSMLDVTKEYYRAIKRDELDVNVPLSNGATIAEYSMHVITINHNRRSSYESATGDDSD